MRTAFSLALCLACAAASAAITVLPGSTPQEAPAGIPFPNQIAVLATDANGNPQRGVSVGFNLPLFNGPQMDANPAAFSCFPDLGLNCYAVTDSNGVAILPGFYGNGVHEYLVYVARTPLTLAPATPTRVPRPTRPRWAPCLRPARRLPWPPRGRGWLPGLPRAA